MGRGLSKREFERVFSSGRKHSLPQVHLFRSSGTGKIGIATSRKIGNRPQRNRQRRIALEIVRKLGGVPPNLDVVLLLQQSFAQGDFSEKKLWIEKLFQQIKTDLADDSA
jgi:ribonuclease P protein component